MNIYVIVPGENIKTVTLDRPVMNLLSGGGTETLTATLTGGADDGADEKLVWTLTQDENDPVVKMVGDKADKNRKITLLPVKAGTATLMCLVPSSQKSATCQITVEEQKSLYLDSTMVSSYYTKETKIHYTTLRSNFLQR